METRANYVMVGSFVLVIFAGIFVALRDVVERCSINGQRCPARGPRRPAGGHLNDSIDALDGQPLILFEFRNKKFFVPLIGVVIEMRDGDCQFRVRDNVDRLPCGPVANLEECRKILDMIPLPPTKQQQEQRRTNQ